MSSDTLPSPILLGRLATGRAWVSEARRLDWAQVRWEAGRYPVPVVVAALVIGLAVGTPWAAMVVVGAAVSVGFGAFHQLTRYRLVPMGVATVGFAVSAWVGAVVGRHNLAASLGVAVVWGTVFGATSLLGQGAWWVGLQCVIALCVSAAYPTGVWPATQRVLLVLLGGALQTAAAALIWWAGGEPFTHVQTLEPLEWVLRPTGLGFRYPLGNAGLRYTGRVPAVLAAAVVASHLWWWPNGYWIPMTAAIVLKPDLRTTFTRGVARMAGTVVGVTLVTGLTAAARPTPAVLAGVIVLAVAAAFTVQKVNYGLFAACITAYVVCLLSLGGLPEPAVALRRTLATLVGGTLALGSYLVMPAGRTGDESKTGPAR